jgi:hypothetical protein
MTDYKTTKLDRNQARKNITQIVAQHPENVHFSNHARNEMTNDGLTTVDIWNVIKSPDSRILDEGELERGSYRYRLETNYIMVVIAFHIDGTGFNIVTVWDKRK